MIKDIKGYLGLYAITDDGNVWSYPRLRSSTNGKWLKQKINSSGYLLVLLYKNGKGQYKLVHRLVAETFINIDNVKLLVDHIDRNKLNNNVSNLRYANRSLQIKNQDRSSDSSKEAYKNNSDKAHKALEKKVLCVETNTIYLSAALASRQTGINKSSIPGCCRGTLKTAGGYRWKYVGDSNG